MIPIIFIGQIIFGSPKIWCIFYKSSLKISNKRTKLNLLAGLKSSDITAYSVDEAKVIIESVGPIAYQRGIQAIWRK